MPTDKNNKLNELDKQEFWDIARQIKPGITEEEFEKQWAEFQVLKQRKKLQ